MLRVLGACSLVLSVGCRGASTPIVNPKEGPTSAPPPPTATASPPPKPAPSTVASTYPAHTDACTRPTPTVARPTTGSTAASRCETAVGDHAWVAKVDAYCKAAEKAGTVKGCSPTICGGAPPPKPGQLGYINAIPRCAAGHCKK